MSGASRVHLADRSHPQLTCPWRFWTSQDGYVNKTWTGRELLICVLAATFVASFGRRQLAPSNHSPNTLVCLNISPSNTLPEHVSPI